MKKYNGEKAVISLTSWKKRINTVEKTVFSILKSCPGFHVVLTLSEDEFPNKEKDLPENLINFVDNDLIEILWVKKNYKSLKKILFAMDKYREVPIISADDDCVYKCNYAEELYRAWLKDKQAFVCTKGQSKYYNTVHANGPVALHPPYFYGENGLKYLTDKVIERNQDDDYYMVLRRKMKLSHVIILPNKLEHYVWFHRTTNSLAEVYTRGRYCNDTVKIYESIIRP